MIENDSRPSFPPLSPEEFKILSHMKFMAESMHRNTKPFSAGEYLAMAAFEATKALAYRNKGVGAIVSLRTRKIETVIGAHNRVRSDGSTHLHAEEYALDKLEEFLKNKYRPGPQDLFFQRPFPTDENKLKVTTTLESCMGCLRRIISCGVSEVLVGAADPRGGQMLNGRMSGIAPDFREEAQSLGLEVFLPNFTDSKNPFYIDEVYQDFLQNSLGQNGIDFRLPKEVYAWINYRFNKTL